MAIRAPLYYSAGNLKEMTSTEVDEIISQAIYQYSLAPSVALSVVNSGGNIGSITDTFLFFSIAFYASGIPWVTLALGDLTVKILIALLMLIPFKILINKIKDYSENSVSDIKL